MGGGRVREGGGGGRGSDLCLSSSVQVLQELVRLDEQELSNKYKVGVIYCKSGQETEEEMYNNGGCGLRGVVWRESGMGRCGVGVACWVLGIM